MSAPAVGSERNTNDRTVHRNQPSPRPAPRPASPVASNQHPQRERTNFSAEARGRERSNAGNALSGLAGLAGHFDSAVGERGRAGAGLGVGASASVRIGPSDRGPNWHAESNPQLNDRHRRALDEIAPLYANRFHHDLVVVSGERGAQRTAQTWAETEAGGRGRTARLYSGQDGYRAYNQAWQQVLERNHGRQPTDPIVVQQFTREVTRLMGAHQFISNHQAGFSFDLSVNRSHMSNTSRDFLIQQFQQRGFRTTFEGDHLHVDLPHAPRETTARPDITSAEARVINRNQRQYEIEQGAYTELYELGGIVADPSRAHYRTIPNV